MKKVITMLLCFTISGVAANAQDKKQSITTLPATQAVDPDAGRFTFLEETHDYGEVPEGPFAECDFVFKNTGKKPITINEAHGSCGCTVPEWPHESIMPGQNGTIHVKYTTTGRQGPINKDITVNSNAQQSPMVLHIKGTVKPRPAEVITPSGANVGK